MNEKIKEVFELAMRYYLGYIGATYVEEKRVKEYIKSKSEEYEFDKNEVGPCLHEIKQTLTSDLIYNPDRHRYYFQNEYDAERKIIDYLISQEGKISDRDFTRQIKSAQRASRIKYSEEQEAAIATVFQHRLSVITGGPGTGKTIIIQGIYQVADKLGYHVRIFAPTGKAAMRIQEATELFATTIHKGLIEEIYSQNKNLIIIDEASMIDSYLMGLIIEHWGMFTIVLIGDVNQLPSVGNGEVLFDIIHSGKVAVTYLSKGYRSEVTIVANANMALQNMLVKDWKFDSSFRFIPVKFRILEEQNGLDDMQINQFKKIVYKYWRHLTDKFDIEDVIILLPLKREDIEQEKFITSDTINEYIQSMRFCGMKENYKYYVGDRVIYTKNRYDNSTGSGINLYNGMTGTVSEKKEDGWLLIQFDNGYESEFLIHEDDENLELAYALTVHKAQGSEYKAVIFLAMNFHVTNRYLFYTAVTRAKEQAIILGRYDLLSYILNIKKYYRRTTFLKDSFSIQVREILKKITYEDGRKWNDECLVYDKNRITFPFEEYGLVNKDNHIIKSDALAGGIYSHDFTKNEMKVLELYFASINIGDAASRFQAFDLKRMNRFRTGRISEAHVLEISEKFRNLFITIEALRYNKNKKAEIVDEWPYLKMSRNKNGKKCLKVFEICEWDKNMKKFILQISDELIPIVFQIQPITGYIKEYPLEFVDRMSPKDVLLFNYFRRYLGKSLVWTYERLNKIFRLEPGTYNTISDFNKFFRELNKSIAANTDMQITFEDYYEEGKNGHLYHKYKIDILERPVEIAINTMPYSEDETEKDTNLSLQSVSVVPENHPVIRKWKKCIHEITGTEYLRLVDK